MRFRALVAVVGVLLAAMTVNALAASQVKSVRLWRAPDNTRLVFDLSGPVQHSVFTLTAPDRLVIDINGASLAAPLKVSTAQHAHYRHGARPSVRRPTCVWSST